MFKDKSIGFYIKMAGAGFALITATMYLIGGLLDESFFALVLILLLIGIAVDVVSVFKYYSFLPAVSTVFYAAAFGVYLGNIFTDIFNTFVNMAEKSLPLFFLLCVFMFLSAAASITGCFLEQRKSAAN